MGTPLVENHQTTMLRMASQLPMATPTANLSTANLLTTLITINATLMQGTTIRRITTAMLAATTTIIATAAQMRITTVGTRMAITMGINPGQQLTESTMR